MAEELRDRLRRLLRADESAREPSPRAPAAAALPEWFRARAARTKSPDPALSSDDPTPPARERTVGAPRDLEHVEMKSGSFALRRTVYDESDAHGAWKLSEIAHCEDGVFEKLTGDPALATLNARDAVFLDIETTGLSGGAGTHVFLVGLAWFEGERFVVSQGFLRGPEDEPALLEHCAERLARAPSVISFFGKSFDRHRLEDKMRLHGIAPPFRGLAHLDLYYACRKLYRAALPDGRLATVEHALCGVEREHDLPGAFAPAAWFDFLGGRAHLLEDVFRHNLLDVLSLVVLCAHLGRASQESRGDGSPLSTSAAAEVARAHALARLHADRGELEHARLWIDRALVRDADEMRTRELRALRSTVLRKLGLTDEALEDALFVAHGARDALAAQASLDAARLLARACRHDEALALARRAIDVADVTLFGAKKMNLLRSAGYVRTHSTTHRAVVDRFNG